MGSFVSLRPAAREDATELALLTDIASHGFASWLWLSELGNGGCDTPMERGRQKLRGDQGQGNWSDAVIAEAYGEIAGAAIGFGLDEGIRNIQADRPALKPVIDLQKMVLGSWFIATLGVYSHLRGIGIGRRLLEDQIERAEDAPVSLITADYNEAALSLYKKNEFSEAARADAVAFFENGRKHEWVLLTRDAR
ncbi:GNAT family N-acetyltransferase [Rhizobium grahamii]|uniref:Acetyltransferase n=1 Tax=Rhizobium grahamii CCGE 502 TaxID=990285 RepID=S3HZZ4_9HYPH|nr:GNAT family N-acetyltransferase [Rhizobium grahamii]EPE98556.1 acetyltransferase [Rhizobium grahamii CCGE 502]